MERLVQDKKLIEILKSGGIAVIPTDTIYGIVCQAMNQGAVDRLYQVRQRSPEKPCIILIGDEGDVEKFGVILSPEQKMEIKKYWHGKVSIIFDCLDDRFEYLHRGTNSLSFRLPADYRFRDFLKQTGPIIAPSANIEGQPPAKNITEARQYFGDRVDYYKDEGDIISAPSKIIRLYKDGSVAIIRQ